MSQTQMKAAYTGFEDTVGVFFDQLVTSAEYAVWIVVGATAFTGFAPRRFLILGVIMGVIAAVAVVYLGVHHCVAKVNRVFGSLGFDITKGFGRAHWIVDGKHPLSQDILRIRSGGYSVKDFEIHLDQIAMRLGQPVKEIRQPVPTKPILEIVLKKTDLPSSVSLLSLPYDTLASGEFFFGLGPEGPEKGSLTTMIHMLVAGQTGMGKTSFLKQFIATVLSRTRDSFVLLIDMKSGIDFQAFESAPNFELVANHELAHQALERVVKIFERRRDYLLSKKKEKWSELHAKELREHKDFATNPIGPIVVVIDELAELSKKATESAARSDLQERLASLARLARFTGIHLVLGTQRPDKTTINMQSKDNLPTRLCMSVPSVQASTLVVGDMNASTLGRIPGRAVMLAHRSSVIQTPYVANATITELLARSPYLQGPAVSARSILRAGVARPAAATTKAIGGV